MTYYSFIPSRFPGSPWESLGIHQELVGEYKVLRSGDTIYWLKGELVKEQAHLISMLTTVFSIDFDLMHHWMGHPSKDMLRQAISNTENFLKTNAFVKVAWRAKRISNHL